MRSSLGYIPGLFLPIGPPRVRTYIHTCAPSAGKRINSRSGGEEYFSGFGYGIIITCFFHSSATLLSHHLHIIYLGYEHVGQPCREKNSDAVLWYVRFPGF